MIRAVLLLALILATASPASAQNARTNGVERVQAVASAKNTAEKEIRDLLEQSVREALSLESATAQSQIATFERNYARDYMSVGSNGTVYTLTDILKEIRKDPTNGSSAPSRCRTRSFVSTVTLQSLRMSCATRSREQMAHLTARFGNQPSSSGATAGGCGSWSSAVTSTLRADEIAFLSSDLHGWLFAVYQPQHSQSTNGLAHWRESQPRPAFASATPAAR
jgi:hypothetical protein